VSTQNGGGAGDRGAMRERLFLEREEITPDDIGGSSSTWSVVATPWADLRLGAADTERRAGAGSWGRAVWRIRIRLRRDIGPGMRFRKGAADGGSTERIFHILAAGDDDGRRRFLTCVCEERT
jgi:head-tail adaptor